jgi:hypothetical protein
MFGKKKNPKDRYAEGYGAASEAIMKQTDTLFELYSQAKGDLHPTEFTKGWIDACLLHMGKKQYDLNSKSLTWTHRTVDI